MFHSKNSNLTTGNPFRSLLTFAIPVIIGNLFQLFYTLADSVIVGKTLGTNALAAVGSSSMIIYFVLCFINGLTSGFGICLGQRYGAKDTAGMQKSIASSAILSVIFTVLLTFVCCFFSHQLIKIMKIPSSISRQAYVYMFIILLGTGATIFYNLISNMLRALGDSKTPLYFLVFSSLLNIVLDLLFILFFHIGVAGAAWATIISQLLSGLLCLIVGLKKYPVLHLHKTYFDCLRHPLLQHLKLGFQMGFQMSVMCIGQLAMQIVVNSLGTSAVAGYTAATKVDQISVLINNAMITAISTYVAQNFGVGNKERIHQGVRACLIQTECFNLMMCAGILVLRHSIVRLFLSNPSPDIYHYSDSYLTVIAPFYFLLGLLSIYRAAVQSMNNSLAPFMGCMIELFMRLTATLVLSAIWGYFAVCIASPLAWFGSCSLLIPCYYKMQHSKPKGTR